MAAADSVTAPGRTESPEERADRNFIDLLQELRVAHTGVQILLAFLLTLAFTQQFSSLSRGQTVLYATTITATALALTLLVAPVATHRISFRMDRKEQVLRVSHLMTLGGITLMAVSVVAAVGLAMWTTVGLGWAVTIGMTLSIALVVFWLVIPLAMCRNTARNGRRS